MTNTKKQITVLIAFSLLSACSSGQGGGQYKSMQPDRLVIPDNWAAIIEADSSSKINTKWITDQELPQLTMHIAEALRENPELAKAKARVNSAKAQVGIADASTLPTVNGNFSASRNRTPGATGAINSTQFDLGASLSWELDVWGRVEASYQASVSSLAAAELDYKAASFSVATRTTEAWLALINAQEQRKLSELTVGALTRLVTISERRYERGAGAILDLRLAERDLASGMADLELRHEAETAAARSLEILLGRYPSGAIRVDQPFPVLAPQGSLIAPSELLNARPDVQAAYMRLQASVWQLEEAEAAKMPLLNLSASTTFRNNNLEDLLDADNLVSSILGSLVQPIFDGGRKSQTVKLSEAQLDEQSASYLQTILTAFEETEGLLTEAYHQSNRQQYLELSLARAWESEELSERQYNAGLISFSDLLQAQRTRFAAEAQLVALRHQRLKNRANLHLALGGQSIPIETKYRSECISCQ